MKIKVKLGKERERKHGSKYGIRRINLAFPNAILKSRLTVKIIRKGIESNAEDGKTPIISPEYFNREIMTALYKCLKTVIKTKGHFNLLEVDASDGTKVIIRI